MSISQQGTYYTVSSLNRFLKTLLDSTPSLHSIYIKGEVSNLKKHISGHYYFTLKDEESRLSAVMFARDAEKVSFPVKDGDEVVVLGSISVYPANGSYQIYVYEMTLFGVGQQLLELEKLKKKLAGEGLFDESRKREINLFPEAIGIVTAKGSAAAKDMIFNIHRRYPLCEIFLFPSLVQGENAPKDLVRALRLAQSYPLDTIIIGRGGGANEDLSAFNEENVVRAVAASKIPVISAVGHEIDTTLCDFAADKRASTPTGAAELATVDRREIESTLANSQDRLYESIENKITKLKETVKTFKNRPYFINPALMYHDKIVSLEHLKGNLLISISSRLKASQEQTKQLSAHLAALNPNSILSRGYSYVTDSQGKIISSVDQIAPSQLMKTVLKDGTITSTVVGKDKKEHGKEKN